MDSQFTILDLVDSTEDRVELSQLLVTFAYSVHDLLAVGNCCSERHDVSFDRSV